MGRTFQVCSAEAATAYYAANPELSAIYYLTPCVDAQGKVSGWENQGSPPVTNWVAK
jgi:hypothetical protein